MSGRTVLVVKGAMVVVFCVGVVVTGFWEVMVVVFWVVVTSFWEVVVVTGFWVVVVGKTVVVKLRWPERISRT